MSRNPSEACRWRVFLVKPTENLYQAELTQNTIAAEPQHDFVVIVMGLQCCIPLGEFCVALASRPEARTHPA
jgi:hypothetical protein